METKIIQSSGICKNSRQENDGSTENKLKSSFLCILEDDLFWKGDLESLKEFVKADLQIDGRWSSSRGRGESIQFSNPDFCLKWHGPTEKRLSVMQGNDESHLLISLKSYATLPMPENDDCQKNNEVEHVAPRVVVVVEDEGAESNQSTIIVDENCSNCEHYREELNNLLIIVSEIKKKQDKDQENSESEMAKTDAKLKSLIEDNNKMAAEIQALKINVEETSNDNAVIRSVLDVKQGEWTKIEHSKSTDKKVTESANNNITQSQNRFEALDDENEEEASDGNQINNDVNAQISKYRAKQKENFVKSRDAKQPKVSKEKPKMDLPAKEEERTPTLEPSKESIDLVIGDSMVKNIDNMKLTRAAKKRTVCHSYSGATVKQIAAKFDEHVKEESSYGRVIIHVGTNDLARTQPDKVIKNMEALIMKVKTKSQRSCCIRHYKKV